MGREKKRELDLDTWEWMLNPFPPSEENDQIFGVIRRRLGVGEEPSVKPHLRDELSGADKNKLNRLLEDDFFVNYNPFIRHIVRRTREYLENKIDPETNEPYFPKVEVELSGEKPEETITLPPYLREAYKHAENFSRLLKERVRGGGFIRTLLLRRVGSTIIAGKNTAEKMFYDWPSEFNDEDEFENEEIKSEIKNLTEEELKELERFIQVLRASQEKDPKYNEVYRILVDENWIKRGCIIFSQYYDSALWLAEELSKDLLDKNIGLYAGGDKSRLFFNGISYRKSKEELKKMVREREIKVLVGTDAASEGLNLQTLGSLINLDLPWNPTRLEQRKGRIQRIGQVHEKVWIHNMRYKDSVEDRVHQLLSERLENLRDLFGQIPDILEDVWVDVAFDEIERAKERIDEVPDKHPFDIRYQQHVERVDWETCEKVLDSMEKKDYFRRGWE